MARIAFVTCERLANGNEDDQLAAEILRRDGWAVDFVVWNRADLHGYDFAVMRTVWDYYLHYPDFVRWLDTLETQGVRLLNPVDTIRWNSRKDYLLEFEKRGIAIVPSVYARCGDTVDLGAVMSERGWDKAVVKPAVSAGAHETWVTSGQNGDQPRLDALVNKVDVLVQPFLPEIEAGEWSFLFFNRQFSHAMFKRPNNGDFRVQPQHGGSHTATPAPQELLAQAQKIVDAIDGELLYARVDGVDRDGTLLLMELELIEPFLFLAYDPAAPAHFAAAIKELAV